MVILYFPLSYPILSFRLFLILSYPILSSLSYPILSSLSFPILSYPILSFRLYPILSSYPILSFLLYPFLAYPILAYPILSSLSYPILSYSILSCPDLISQTECRFPFRAKEGNKNKNQTKKREKKKERKTIGGKLLRSYWGKREESPFFLLFSLPFPFPSLLKSLGVSLKLSLLSLVSSPIGELGMRKRRLG